MKIDARQLELGCTVKIDICVIGAGPAGLTFAHEFIGTGLRLAVLESGDSKPDKQANALSKGQISGVLTQELPEVHARQIGGTANHWIIKMADKRNGFRHVPLDHLDFKERDYIRFSGWPIGREDLDPYYRRVHEVCEIGTFEYGSEYWENNRARALKDETRTIESGIFSFGATHYFTHDWPASFAESNHIDLYTHATVVELATDFEGLKVVKAIVRVPGGYEITFEADVFIIAAGGFDTAKLLLNSNRQFAAGLGNQNDVVGRYYMDHSLVLNGYFYPKDPEFLRKLAFYDMRLVEGASVLGKFSLSEEVREREQLRNLGAMIFPMPRDDDQLAIESLRGWMWDLQKGRFPHNFALHTKRIVKGWRYLIHVMLQRYLHDASLMPGLGQGGWSELHDLDKRFSRLQLMSMVEQSPNPNNRVTLLDERDSLGCRMVKAHMDWTPEDLVSVRRTQALMVEKLQELGFGDFQPNVQGDELVYYSHTAHHIMGTARMSDNPKTGVVDRNCNVHGLANLYIASSAVFTTGGYANPTLTILALSIRIADDVKRLFEQK